MSELFIDEFFIGVADHSSFLIPHSTFPIVEMARWRA